MFIINKNIDLWNSRIEGNRLYIHAVGKKEYTGIIIHKGE
jgi:hypothetical protein